MQATALSRINDLSQVVYTQFMDTGDVTQQIQENTSTGISHFINDNWIEIRDVNFHEF